MASFDATANTRWFFFTINLLTRFCSSHNMFVWQYVSTWIFRIGVSSHCLPHWPLPMWAIGQTSHHVSGLDVITDTFQAFLLGFAFLNLPGNCRLLCSCVAPDVTRCDPSEVRSRLITHLNLACFMLQIYRLRSSLPVCFPLCCQSLRFTTFVVFPLSSNAMFRHSVIRRRSKFARTNSLSWPQLLQCSLGSGQV